MTSPEGRPAVALLGLPWDAGSSHRRGAANGPRALRRALASPASNRTAENGVDLDEPGLLADLGDVGGLDPGDPEGARKRIREAAVSALDAASTPLFLGGDHSVTLPVLRAVAQRHGPLAVLHLDAHPDLYPELGGDRYSHACPFARALEEGLVRRLVQVGIRTMNTPQREVAERYGVEVVEVAAATTLTPVLEGPAYLSLDLDVLDPAFAPGVAHPEPGGLSTRELLELLGRTEAHFVAADVVELNPTADPSGSSAIVAAKIVKEIAGRLAGSG